MGNIPVKTKYYFFVIVKLKALFLPLIIFFLRLDGSINPSFKNSQIIISSTNASLALNEAIKKFDGLINLSDQTKITGAPFGISESGKIRFGSETTISNSLDAGAGDIRTTYLAGGQTCCLKTSTMPINLIVTGAEANIFVAAPGQQGDLILKDSSCSASITGSSPTQLNIYLNGGKLYLQSNLILNSASQIWGPGTIFLNGYQLQLTNTNINTELNFDGNGKIFFSGRSQTNGMLYFNVPSANGLEVSGGSIDFAQNGQSGLLFFGPGTATMSFIELHGIGSADSQGAEINSVNTLSLDTTILSLSTTYTQLSSLNFINGPSTVLTNTYTWWAGGNITVNDCTLFYDRRNQAWPQPIVTYGSGSVTLLSGARLAPISALNGRPGLTGQSGANRAGLAAAISPNVAGFRQGDPRQFTGSSTFTFRQNQIFDALDATFNLPDSTAKSWIFSTNGTATTFTNVKILGYDEQNVRFRTGNRIYFGDNCELTLTTTKSLTSTSRTWTFSGNSSIDGNNLDLFLAGTPSISVANGSTLTIKRCNIYPLVPNCIFLRSNDSKLVLQNVNIAIPSTGFVFPSGNLEFSGDCKITNSGDFAGTSTSSFSFTTEGNLAIDADSSLTLDKNVYFKYSPYLNGIRPFFGSNNITLSDPSSVLTLNGCSLECSYSGFSLNNGTIAIRDTVNLILPTSSPNTAILGNNCQVIFDQGATLNVSGQLKLC